MSTSTSETAANKEKFKPYKVNTRPKDDSDDETKYSEYNADEKTNEVIKQCIVQLNIQLNDDKVTGQGTGTIICIKKDKLFVLTCAHNVKSATLITMEYDNEKLEAQPNECRIYPKYQPQRKLNDIAIIEFKLKSVKQETKVMPAFQVISRSDVVCDGEYIFTSKFSGKVFDVEAYSYDLGSKIVQYDWNHGDNQKFYVKEVNTQNEEHKNNINNNDNMYNVRWFSIQSKSSKLFWNIGGETGTNENAATLQQWEDKNQLFSFENCGFDCYRITIKNSKNENEKYHLYKSLDVEGASFDSGTHIIQQESHDVLNQLFYCQRVFYVYGYAVNKKWDGPGSILNDGRMIYKIDTECGQSGSPICYNNNIVGIHTTGNKVSRMSYGTTLNYEMVRWMMSFGCTIVVYHDNHEKTADVQQIAKLLIVKNPKDTINPNKPTTDLKQQIKVLTDDIIKFAKDKNINRLVLFLHGYNNGTEAVNTRLGSMDTVLDPSQSQLISAAFNWQSAAYDVAHLLSGYDDDQKNAKESDEWFVEYLELLTKNSSVFNQVDIIAHSMGNYVLSNAILYSKDCGKLKVFQDCNIVCLAADVNKYQYRTTVEAAHSTVRSWTHYWNEWDVALNASEVMNHSSKRAGEMEYKNENGTGVVSVHWKTLYYGGGHGYIDDPRIQKDIKEKLGIS